MTALQPNNLKAFAREVLAFHTGSLDGCDIAEMAEKYGLVKLVNVTETCGETCFCGELNGFPTECYRLADWIKE